MLFDAGRWRSDWQTFARAPLGLCVPAGFGGSVGHFGYDDECAWAMFGVFLFVSFSLLWVFLAVRGSVMCCPISRACHVYVMTPAISACL